MDQRKLIQHGASSLTVALPKKWLDDRGIKKGDSIYINDEGNKLILSTDLTLKMKKISTNITDLDRTSVILYIQSLYRYGYDEMEIMFDKPETTHHRKQKKVTFSSVIHFVVNRLIGAEVIEQKDNKIVIKHITREIEDDFKIILRRVFLLLKELSENLYDGTKNLDINLLETIEEKHDNITKFVSYCLRLLNKYGYPDVRKTSMYFHIIASVDKIVDIFKYVARDLKKTQTKFSKDGLKICEQVDTSVKLYYELFFAFSNKLVDQLSENRDNVKRGIEEKMKKVKGYELIYITSLKQVLEIILDLTEFRMGLEY